MLIIFFSVLVIISYNVFYQINLQEIVNADLHLNSHSRDYKSDAFSIDRRFYSELPRYLIKQLYDAIYEPDFRMLGYEYPQQYIDMGMNNNEI